MEINSRAAEVIIIILILVGVIYFMYLNYIEIAKLKKQYNKEYTIDPEIITDDNLCLDDDHEEYSDSEETPSIFLEDPNCKDDDIEVSPHQDFSEIFHEPIQLEPIHHCPSPIIIELDEEQHSLCQKIYKIGALKGKSCTIPVVDGATFCHKHKK